MPKILSTEEFIYKSNLIHDNKYDYSEVCYVNAKTPVIIKCSFHGKFNQTPDNHLHKRGCFKCGIIKRSEIRIYSSNDFLEKAFEVHKNKYDYSKVKYKRSYKKVIIRCHIHGEFLQLPRAHLQGQGCPYCADKFTSEKRKISIDEFIKRANNVHKNFYKYVNIIYIRNNVLVDIVCPLHGIFKQRPDSHLRGQGCSSCAGNKESNTEEFIIKSIKIHKDKYDYSKVLYDGALKKVQIKCPKHGAFYQTPANHLLHENGCPKCSNNISKQEISFLDYVNIKERNKRLPEWIMKPVDGYDSQTNTIYEFLGDYWHGNPIRFNPTDIHPNVGVTFGKLYKQTFINLNKIKLFGYNVKYIWESDWNNFKRGKDQIPNIISL